MPARVTRSLLFSLCLSGCTTKETTVYVTVGPADASDALQSSKSEVDVGGKQDTTPAKDGVQANDLSPNKPDSDSGPSQDQGSSDPGPGDDLADGPVLPDGGPTDDVHKPPPKDGGGFDTSIPAGECWKPAGAPMGIDCAAFCAAAKKCAVDTECESGCALVTSYLEPSAGAKLLGCIQSAPCGYTNAFELFQSCLMQLPKLGYTAPAAAKTTCDALNAQLQSCAINTGSAAAEMCFTFSTAFTSAAIAQVEACASAPCADVKACLLAANCTLGPALVN